MFFNVVCVTDHTCACGCVNEVCVAVFLNVCVRLSVCVWFSVSECVYALLNECVILRLHVNECVNVVYRRSVSVCGHF